MYNIIKKVLNENISDLLKKRLGLNNKDYLYHATPACYLSSIKQNGLGGKIPKIRFWNYEGTSYSSIKQGIFLATDEYVAESYLDSSDKFADFAEWYEDKYNKELSIIVFQIKVSDLRLDLLSIDKNQSIDDDMDKTYFYDGIIPFNKLKMIKLY